MKWMMVEIVTGYNDAGAATSTINYINPKYIVRIKGDSKLVCMSLRCLMVAI